jgi:CheY-like chemotaxis protein
MNSLRILVVDDVEANRMLAKALLGRLGHRVETAEDGAQALDRVQRETFDLVLMDMDMPVMDGIAATRAIRALAGPAAGVPIVALTSRNDEASRQAALEAGMSDFLSKPLQPAMLAATLISIMVAKASPAGPSSSERDPPIGFYGAAGASTPAMLLAE